MSHRHFCDVAGHEYECTNPNCECICGMPMEGESHSDCPVELKTCAEHLNQENVPEEVGGVPISFPSDFEVNAERAFRELETSEAACLWCGYGHAEYSPKAELEHFAYHCPYAPEDLKESAQSRLESSRQKGRR